MINNGDWGDSNAGQWLDQNLESGQTNVPPQEMITDGWGDQPEQGNNNQGEGGQPENTIS